jgi:hypothetical protein
MNKPKVTRKRWSPQDDKLLKQLFYLKKPYPDIAKQLNRSTDAVRRRIRRFLPLWKLQEQQLSKALSDITADSHSPQDNQDPQEPLPSTFSPLRIIALALASAAFLYLLLR